MFQVKKLFSKNISAELKLIKIFNKLNLNIIYFFNKIYFFVSFSFNLQKKLW